MKKIVTLIFFVFVAGLLAHVSVANRQKLRGAKSTNTTPKEDMATAANYQESQVGDFLLTSPKDFQVDFFALVAPKARVMTWSPDGKDLWLAQTKEGKITKMQVVNNDPVRDEVVFSNLRNPHGLAFDPEDGKILYVAEEHQLSRVDLRAKDWQKIADFPSSKGEESHFTRTIKFGPDSRLYVSIGSSCNVCREEHPWRASIISMNKDGSDAKVFARGLRNAVFFAWSEVDGRMWATEMGRDQLGDDLPPDEINIIEEGKNYGWPICYGKNIHDDAFDKNTYIRNPCLEPFETESHIDLPAHVAPLGLAFIPESTVWPEDWWHDLLVAEHGSWNRSEPVGYKVVRIKLDAQGNYEGTEDFISGWLTTTDEGTGRPVDILVKPEGVVLISDDRAGVIYRVRYNGK